MAGRSDAALVCLVLFGAMTILFAPVLGRNGWPALATGLMVLAAGAGVTSFLLALVATIRASRRAPRAGFSEEDP
jgi:hypothetical protein